MKKNVLWLSEEMAKRIRQRIEDGEPTAKAIADGARAVADKPEPTTGGIASPLGLRHAECCAISYLATGDRRYATMAAESFLALTDAWTTGNLAKGSFGYHGAIIHEVCHAALEPALQIKLSARLHKCFWAARETEFNTGDPHTVTNNHWAVVHGGAACAGMAVDGHIIDDKGTRADLSEEIRWAINRTKAFASQHGDQGVYHEGLGYLCYPANFWLAALTAWRNVSGEDFLNEFPNIRNLAAAMFTAAAPRPTISDETFKPNGNMGMKLSWNDDGLGFGGGGFLPLMIANAHEHQRGALRWLYDRFMGHLGDKTFGPGFAGWFFTLVCYPFDVPAQHPAGVLPTHLIDYRQGLALYRNRFDDGNDCVFGAYAKVQFPGGHQQDDAGSVRFMALGHDFIMGGGQERGKGPWQSIMLPLTGDRPKPNLGAIMSHEAHSDGGVLAIELRRATGAYHERYAACDFSESTGLPALVGLLDLVDDHLNRDWAWHLTFSPLLKFAPHDDARGFDLTADDAVKAVVRLFGSTPRSLTLEKMPDSKRTFQSEKVPHIYPGKPFVKAEFAFEPHIAVYMVMAVGRGDVPRPELLDGVNVRLGDATWRRPFGPAVPAAYRLNQSGGLCKFSAGVKGFHAS